MSQDGSTTPFSTSDKIYLLAETFVSGCFPKNTSKSPNLPPNLNLRSNYSPNSGEKGRRHLSQDLLNFKLESNQTGSSLTNRRQENEVGQSQSEEQKRSIMEPESV